ncbi:hypothetical protein UA08_01685 [Talaromyces atroroseus]|uniref:Pheromone alpha factor receptor n=1 Tax=Talaromyces atroroseus TaxID=1441469 RepID=A0A1Q5QBE9_TALAT|nr:hypothetical protein UA08_01685 [Talaromyces atroroseus]OKL63265.1 hypothetical protein UA08_01685 [Talaromyces atroroseus]
MSSFDPFEQNITMITGQGAAMHIPIPNFDEHVQEGLTACIDYGSQLGASIVTTILLFLLTRAKKRRSPVFCLNILALLLNTIRLVCQILFYTSAWFESYAFFSGDMSRVSKGDYATSILAAVMTALVELVMEMSLVVQTIVVSTNMPIVFRSMLLAASSLIAATTIGFRMAEMVFNSIVIVAQRTSAPYIWLQKADTILITASICFFSAVFMAKLGYTIYRRKQLGVHQFGPMQVIFIMSCQTMILPAIFSVLQFLSVPIHEINASVLTFVVVSLPVTSIWAGTVVPGQSKIQNVESGPPLWDKLSSGSSTHFDNMASKQIRQNSAMTTVSAAIDPTDLLYRDLEEPTAGADRSVKY